MKLDPWPIRLWMWIEEQYWLRAKRFGYCKRPNDDCTCELGMSCGGFN